MSNNKSNLHCKYPVLTLSSQKAEFGQVKATNKKQRRNEKGKKHVLNIVYWIVKSISQKYDLVPTFEFLSKNLFQSYCAYTIYSRFSKSIFNINEIQFDSWLISEA